jgi:hypothetical protein
MRRYRLADGEVCVEQVIRMHRLFCVLAVAPFAAMAAPPPQGSDDARTLGPHKRWVEAQESDLGPCCSLADGRMVDARIRGGRYEVRFLHPESIAVTGGPEAGVYYVVPDNALLRGANPTGHAIAWWSMFPLSRNGLLQGHIRCFIPSDLY